MRIPFVAGGHTAGDDPERKKLLVPEGRVPRPFPGPWTLRALVRGDGPGNPLPSDGGPTEGGPVEGGGPEPGEEASAPAPGEGSDGPQEAP